MFPVRTIRRVLRSTALRQRMDDVSTGTVRTPIFHLPTTAIHAASIAASGSSMARAGSGNAPSHPFPWASRPQPTSVPTHVKHAHGSIAFSGTRTAALRGPAPTPSDTNPAPSSTVSLDMAPPVMLGTARRWRCPAMEDTKHVLPGNAGPGIGSH